MKKILISVIICIITFEIIFLNINSKENKKEENNENISIILETKEGNIKTNTFPNKEEYEYNKVVCENTSDVVTPTFNSDTWKLNVSVEEEKIDGDFQCNIYFKEKIKLASEVIISRYKENNTEGLIKLEQPKTEQTDALTEYRYSGSNDEVKNYVTFNNETWRIIGVFPTDDGTGNIENRVKIIREESIGDYSWDTSSSSVNSGWGINQWGESGSYEGADLMRLLNPGYESKSVNNSLYWSKESGNCYNGQNNAVTTCNFSSNGLTEKSRNMIDAAKWYTSASDLELLTQESYAEERGVKVGLADKGITITKTINWIGKIGLMYPSDYGYASSGCRDGEQILYNYNNEVCINTNWLYKKTYSWLLAPRSESWYILRYINDLGRVNSHYAYMNRGVYPVTYLRSDVKLTSGDGTESNPYELSL